jgi:hypothetical protein
VLFSGSQEGWMFAQTVQFRIKPRFIEELTRIFNQEIIPLLRQQEGFQDEITFIVPSGMAAVGISFWKEKKDVDTYIQDIYPIVINSLAKVLQGVPKVHTLEVSNSTFHQIPSRESA